MLNFLAPIYKRLKYDLLQRLLHFRSKLVYTLYSNMTQKVVPVEETLLCTALWCFLQDLNSLPPFSYVDMAVTLNVSLVET